MRFFKENALLNPNDQCVPCDQCNAVLIKDDKEGKVSESGSVRVPLG